MTDWCVGDLAVCVKRGCIECGRARHHGEDVPELGAIGRVVEITHDEHMVTGEPIYCGCVVLVFADGSGGVAERFRKIRPDTHEACEVEFVTLLKRTKRKVEA